ncbi:SDR family NAD(P)-dependent oxidoreductase [Actinokineospora sp. NPDC004072]
MDSAVDGKAIVVTGAGRGLGAAFAEYLAASGAGVVVNDVDADAVAEVAERIRVAGGAAVPCVASVADPEDAERIVETAVRSFGVVHGLVNNAGLNYTAKPWEDDPARARELVEVNVLGVINVGLAAVRRMRAAGGGAIVNVSSGALMGQRGLGVYAASKGAVASLTWSWALDLEDDGIRVNALCPKAYTRMVWESPRRAELSGPGETPERIAPLVRFLLSDRAAGITGQVVRCTGTQLHLVGHPYFKAPVLQRDEWDLASVERAFAEVLGGALEPYGLERRQPPPLREWVPA